MCKKGRVFLRSEFLKAFSLVLLTVFLSSCGHLFNETPSNPSGTTSGTGGKSTPVCTIYGELSTEGAMPSELVPVNEADARTAIPVLPVVSYTIKVYQGGKPLASNAVPFKTVQAEIVEGVPRYTVGGLTYTTYTLVAEAKLQDSNEIVLKSSEEEITLDASHSDFEHDFELRPLMDASKKGQVSLEVFVENMPDNFSCEATMTKSSTTEVELDTAIDDGRTKVTITQPSSDGIATGRYYANIVFYKTVSGTKLPVYVIDDVINVCNGLTTSVWVKSGDESGDSPHLIQDEDGDGYKCKITSSMMEEFLATNLYVAETGDNETGDGSCFYPVKTLTKAFEIIKATELVSDFTIRVSGIVDGGIEISDDNLGSNVTSLKICGSSAESDILDARGKKASVLTINTTVPVTLEKLKLTNGSLYGFGGGVNISDDDATVTIAGCAITDNAAEGDEDDEGCGGGIYNAGTLTIRNSSVKNNSAMSGGGVYNNGTLTLDSVEVKDNEMGIFNFVGKTLNMRGQIDVTGNFMLADPESPDSTERVEINVCLMSTDFINVTGSLEGSQIGVFFFSYDDGNVVDAETPKIKITSGFGAKNVGISPDTIFISDTFFSHYDSESFYPCAVISENVSGYEEAFFAVNSGSFIEPTLENITFQFKDSQSNDVRSFYAGSAKDIYITIKKDDTVLQPTDITSAVFKLYCGNHVAELLSPESQENGTFKVTIPATITAPDVYTLFARIKYNGVLYDATCTLNGKDVMDGFVAVYGTTVTGAVGSGDIVSTVFIDGRTIEIPDMYVCDHEVTQGEYKAVMGTNPSGFSDGAVSGEIQENRPVDNVSWYAALAYCNKKSVSENLTPCYTISGITDWANITHSSIPTKDDSTWNAVTWDFSANGYRLPTEAEWEYIARGGLTGTQTKYSGSNTGSSVAWCSENSENKTHEVRKKAANNLGIYDMSGNVYELCWDMYSESGITAETPATGVSSGSKRINRGGCWSDSGSSGTSCSVIHRGSSTPSGWNYYLGFRVVRTIN